MHRTTITLPNELAERISLEARRQHTSVSAVIRRFVEEGLSGRSRRPRGIPWAGILDDSEMTPAARMEEELEAHWADAIAGDRR